MIRSATLVLVLVGCGRSEPAPTPSANAAPSSPTASAPAAVAPSPSVTTSSAPSCQLPGWFVNFAGIANDVEFGADGTGTWHVIRFTSTHTEDVAVQTFRWKLEGKTLDFDQVKPWRVPVGCAPGQHGRYELDFANDCNTIRLRVVDDPCAQRKKQLDGAGGTRSWHETPR